MTEPLISAEHLAKHFDVGGGGIFLRGKTSKLRAVDDVALSIMAGETRTQAQSSKAPAGDGASGLDPRVPAHLWERSRLGRERWVAKQG